MQLHFKNNRLERLLIVVNLVAAGMVAASFVVLFGFTSPLVSQRILYAVQILLLGVFIGEKIVRFLNAASKHDFWGANWFEVPLLLALLVSVLGAGQWFATGAEEASAVRHLAVGIYLIIQVITKLCRTCVNLAASGKNPTRTLIASFLFLIIAGAGFLLLPKAAGKDKERLSFIDALFTSTSATCVTGLIVRDTGEDFSLMGQVVILSLIQLGGLGIVIFGAVFALLLGQALSLRESVAMQDLLSARTLSRLGNMIAFVFVVTVVIEGVGAICMFGMWDDVPGRVSTIHEQWFCSIFHSISSFCNAGFSLFSDSLVGYSSSWGVFLVVCPMIILGGLGFSVLYDLAIIIADRVKRLLKKSFSKQHRFSMEAPKRMRLQTKIVLCVSASLIVLGTGAILLFERYAGGSDSAQDADVLGALFQSITARTAGFNTVDISAMSASSRIVLILLMFIGGSPGSTAGGIKTVTLAVLVMIAVTALRKRGEVEMFRRSIRIAIVGRAITITLLFVAVLFAATLALGITENSSGYTMSDIMFEAGSALGTVGLTTGLTPDLTDAGKLIIILVMLVGRLGPLTLLAALTFDIKPVQYNYPDEAIIVG